MVGELGPRARIVGLLRLPSDDATLDVDLPRARAGAVDTVRGADNLVVLPAFAVAVLPPPVFARDDAVAVREVANDTIKEGETVEEMAHGFLSPPSTASLRAWARGTTS